jgi:hypothetical protein
MKFGVFMIAVVFGAALAAATASACGYHASAVSAQNGTPGSSQMPTTATTTTTGKTTGG